MPNELVAAVVMAMVVMSTIDMLVYMLNDLK